MKLTSLFGRRPSRITGTLAGLPKMMRVVSGKLVDDMSVVVDCPYGCGCKHRHALLVEDARRKRLVRTAHCLAGPYEILVGGAR